MQVTRRMPNRRSKCTQLKQGKKFGSIFRREEIRSGPHGRRHALLEGGVPEHESKEAPEFEAAEKEGADEHVTRTPMKAQSKKH